MDALKKAIYEVKRRIPPRVLEKAFTPAHSSWFRPSESNLDEQILSLVVRPRVLVDCDLVGGVEAMIPIGDLPFDKTDNTTSIVRIPKDRTEGKSITSVLHVAFLSMSNANGWSALMGLGTNPNYDYAENGSVMGAALGVLSAVDKIPVTSTANAQLIAENVIMIRDVINTPANSYLRCILTNDPDLNNIQPRSYMHICKLIEFAVKSYIYNETIVDIDTAELQGGFNLGVVKTIIESYADAEQNYQDYLKDKWRAVAMMNDAVSYRRLLKLAIGGNR